LVQAPRDRSRELLNLMNFLLNLMKKFVKSNEKVS
jgi:hypothetical protein